MLAAALAVVAACQPVRTGASSGSGEAVASPAAPARLDEIPLEVVTVTGRFPFIVEVARTGEEQAQGLMGRPPLPPDRGMIFPMRPARWASFWMKDTPSPLDIVFIAPGGQVIRVAEMTEPYSLDPIDSGGPVEAVLEIRGGRAAEIGLVAGSRVIWSDRRR